MKSTRANRILSIVLSLSIVFGITTTSTETILAESDTASGITYTITDGAATITGFTAPTGFDGNLVIPNTLGGSNVTYIGEHAFWYCTEINSVTIPESVIEIGRESFTNCTSLLNATIPSSVKTIGVSSFYNCTNLNNVMIQNGLEKISENAFRNCISLDEIILPESLKSIDKFSFVHCTSLINISILEEVTYIAPDAFLECTSLADINVAANSLMYSSDNGILYSKISKSLLFCPRGKTGEITIPSGITSINENAFGDCTDLTSIAIPNSVTSIGNAAFASCSNIKTFDIPNSDTTIGGYAFTGCESLTEITLPDNLKSIEEATFRSCLNLSKISIPESVTTIGDYAFLSCTKLTSVSIPNGVTSIGGYAFAYCKNIYTLTIPKNVKDIGYIPFTGCTNLSNIYVDSENANFKSIDGILYSGDGKKLIVCPPDTVMANITIPNGVTTIGVQAFYHIESIESVFIPNSVTDIEGSAFSYCSNLSGIILPSGLKNIGGSAFEACSSLSSLRIPESTTNIADRAFFLCTNIQSALFLGNAPTIGNSVFNACATGFAVETLPGKTGFTTPTWLGYPCSINYGIKDVNNVNVNLNSFYVVVCDVNNNQPISAATVKFGENEQTTDADGVVIINDVSDNTCVYLSVSKDGYNEYARTYNVTSDNRGIVIYLEPSSGTGPYISSAIMTRDGVQYDVRNTKQVFLKSPTNTVGEICSLDVTVNWNGYTPEKIYLSQGDETVLESTDGKFTNIDIADAFGSSDGSFGNDPIFIYAMAFNGTISSLYNTQIVVQTVSNTDFTPGSDGVFNLFKDFGIDIPESVPVFGKTTIDFEANQIPFKYEFEGNIVKITVEPKKVNFFTLANLKTYANIMGSIEYIYTDNGWEMLSGGFGFQAKVKYSIEKQLIVGGFPLYVELGVGAEGTVEGKFENVNSPQQLSGDAKIAISGELGAGVGVVGVVTVGIKGKAELAYLMKLDDSYSKCGVDGSANAVVKIFGGIAAEKEFLKGYHLVYETDNPNGLIPASSSGQLMTVDNLYNLIDPYSHMTFENRSYANWPSIWLGGQTPSGTTMLPGNGGLEGSPDIVLLSSLSNAAFLNETKSADNLYSYTGTAYANKEIATLQTNIYPDAAPKIAVMDGKKVMVWLADYTIRPAANKTTLVYSVYDEGKSAWSDPQALLDNGMADFSPVLTDGFVTWQKASQVFDNGTVTIAAIAASTEIYAAKWNGTGFDTPAQITSNTVVDAQPQLAVSGSNVAVVWSSNTNSDILGTTGVNQIMQSTFDGTAWSVPAVVSDNLHAVTNLSAYYKDSNLYIAYVPDNDNDLNTIEDRDIYLITNGATTQITSNDVIDSNPIFTELNGTTSLFWYSGANINYLSNLADSTVSTVFSEAKQGLTDQFTVLTNTAGKAAILWTQTEDETTEIRGALFDGTLWSEDITVSNNGAYSKYASGILNEDGSILIGFNNTAKVAVGDAFAEGQTNLCTLMVTPSYNLSVSDSVYDEADLVPGMDMPITVDVTNKGELAVNSLTLTVKNGDASTNNVLTVSETLLPGESKTVTAIYKVPETVSNQTISVTVVPEGQTEFDETDNTLSLTIGYADINVLKTELYTTGLTTTAYVTINNESYIPAANMKVEVRADSEDGEILSSIDVGTLNRDTNSFISFDIDPDLLTFTSGIKQIYIVASCDNEQNTGNNGTYVIVDQPTYSVTFDTNGGIAGTGSDYTQQIAIDGLASAPENPPTRLDYIFDGWYKETACANIWDFSADTVTNGMTLYAKWTIEIPATPIELKAVSAGFDSSSLTWDAVTGATGYEIYRSESSTSGFVSVATATSASYTDTGLSTGTTYYYQIKTYKLVDTTTVYSAATEAASVIPIPATPTELKAVSAGYNSNKLIWTTVTGATGYVVYRSTSSTSGFTSIATTSSTSYSNTVLATGTTYYYQIKAYTLAGNTNIYSVETEVVSAKPIPATPTNLKAVSAGYNSNKLTWTAAAGASGYSIYRSTSPTSDFAYIKAVTSTSYTNIELTTGTTYYYQIKAYTLVETTKIYSAVTAAVSAKPLPATPTGLKAASAGYNSNKLTWTAVAGATGYSIYRSTSPTSGFTYIKTVTSGSYTNTGLTTGTTYYYQIKAYTLVGTTKIYSAFTSGVSAKPVPAAPAGLTAARASDTSIIVSWDAVPGATGYALYRSTIPTSGFTYIKSVTSASYTNMGLTTGTTYYYQIKAYTMAGTTKIYSAATAAAGAKP